MMDHDDAYAVYTVAVETGMIAAQCNAREDAHESQGPGPRLQKSTYSEVREKAFHYRNRVSVFCFITDET